MWQPDIPFSNEFIAAIIAIIPIIWIFFGMLKLQLPSYKTGIIALIAVVLIALLIWRMPVMLVAESVIEGLMLGLFPIMWVIFAAIFSYNLLVKSGAMDIIKNMLSGISADPRAQVIIIAFAFGGFMESTAGFGTAVAIPVTIFISLGFEPVLAAVLCLVANTVPVAFGVVGIPVITLSQVTGLSLEGISLYTALQVLPLTLILPLVLVVITTGRFKDIKGMVAVIAVSGIFFAAGQTLVAWTVGPELAAVVGSILTLALFSPLIGALGTFITGSDTSANALFGELQKQTALQIGSSPEWLAASNAAGATIGKMVSPQSIAIAVSAIGLPDLEGKILKRTLKYAIIFVALLGIIVYITQPGG